MTYRNDPYDPKQVALLSQEALDDALATAEKAFAASTDLDTLAAIRHQHLGDKAPVSLARREIGALPPAAKADAGKRVNAARAAIQAAYDSRLAALQAARERQVLEQERVDVTLPTARRPRGARHPLTMLTERIEDLFVGMGYEVAEGPEAELEWYNFDALNIGPDHPARSMMDTPRPCRPAPC
jgi:phenylalanyl-tRNA synthetase alpha chain